MKTAATRLSKKAKDGEVFTTVVDFVDYETGREWMIDYDNSFTFKTKKQTMELAKLRLNNMVEDYEHDNNLI